MNTTDVEREDPTTAEEGIGTDHTREKEVEEEEDGIERGPLRHPDMIGRDPTEVTEMLEEGEMKTDLMTADDERGGRGNLKLNEEKWEDLI